MSGGLENYKHAFLTDDFLLANPSQYDDVAALKQLFQDHIPLLAKCITTHATICPESLLQLQIHMEEKFETLKVNPLHLTTQSNSHSIKEAWGCDSAKDQPASPNLPSFSPPNSIPLSDLTRKTTPPVNNTTDKGNEKLERSTSNVNNSARSSSPIKVASKSLSSTKAAPIKKEKKEEPKQSSKLVEIDQSWSPKLSPPVTATSMAHNLKSRKQIIGSRRDE